MSHAPCSVQLSLITMVNESKRVNVVAPNSVIGVLTVTRLFALVLLPLLKLVTVLLEYDMIAQTSTNTFPNLYSSLYT